MITGIFGRPQAAVTSLSRFRHWSQRIDQINALGVELARQTDEELRRSSLSLRYRALSGESLDHLLPEAFALVRQATERTLSERHYEVQLMGGIAMHLGSIAEMQTGEGKTLAATLPLYLAALMDRGAHLATANDYLAERDASITRDAFGLLGMTVGVIKSQTPREKRRDAYLCDITYAASREFGFDFLRDRLLLGGAPEDRGDLFDRLLGRVDGKPTDQPVQRTLYFCLVDEADSILIDEARTPLIVSSLPGSSQDAAVALYRWSAEVADHFVEMRDYEYDHQRRKVTLSKQGRRQARELKKPTELAQLTMFDLYEHLERAIRVGREFHRDRQYVVRDGEVVIVDENTGRLAEGRKWRVGIHQAVEAREGLEIGVDTGEAARVTVQDFFRQYDRLAGMTGTAWPSRHELKRIYELHVQVIPTWKPSQRQHLPDRVLGTADQKWRAVVQEVVEMHAIGRPVLVGTRSIDHSETLSVLLTDAGIEHEVLNANRHAAEAAIVAQAGQYGKVIVATNMAGRGTDIKLEEGVDELGGLHVICTELHDSARIDRQLIGRCARQGDRGSYRQFMALDDQVVKSAYGPETAERFRLLGLAARGSVGRFASRLRRAQRKVEREHYRGRRLLLYHEKHRRRVQDEMGQDPYLDATM
ncbi:MAG: helicase-related protein [Pirellulaceae bacterium]|jgi:preprotein translocase subunit SecA|nr:helicase-related protein [Pirellulaceae bacterium]